MAMNPKNHHDNCLGSVLLFPVFLITAQPLWKASFLFPIFGDFFLPRITDGGIAASWMINVDVDKGAWVIERWMWKKHSV